MQEDIEHGGMAAYITEVAIDAALINTPSAEGRPGPFQTSQTPYNGDETSDGDAIHLRNLQTRSYLRLSDPDDELGDFENTALAYSKNDDG